MSTQTEKNVYYAKMTNAKLYIFIGQKCHFLASNSPKGGHSRGFINTLSF